MGTGVMTGAGIFALTGQIAELYWALFPAGLFLSQRLSPTLAPTPT